MLWQVKELYAHLEPSDSAACSVLEGVWVSTISSVKKMRVFATTKVKDCIRETQCGEEIDGETWMALRRWMRM